MYSDHKLIKVVINSRKILKKLPKYLEIKEYTSKSPMIQIGGLEKIC